MSILNDLEKVGKDVEQGVDQIGAEIDKDLKKAVDAVQTGLAKAKALLEQGFDDVDRAIIQKVVDAAKSKYAGTIGKLRTLATEGITSADPKVIIADIVAAFEHADGAAAQAVLSNLVTTPMQSALAGFDKDFKALTLYADGEIDLAVGVAAVAGGGIRIGDAGFGDARMLMDFGASAGAEEGGDVGLALGLWTESPKDLQGGFISATLGADEGVGANVIFYLSMAAPPEFTGVVLDLTGGEEVEASLDCGFTLAFKVPPPA